MSRTKATDEVLDAPTRTPDDRLWFALYRAALAGLTANPTLNPLGQSHVEIVTQAKTMADYALQAIPIFRRDALVIPLRDAE